MSTRFRICSISSILPIRDAVGTKETSLVKELLSRFEQALRDEYDGDDPDEDELEEFKDTIEQIIISDPPSTEPGEWQYAFDAMTDHFSLDRKEDFPINMDWKHNYVWQSYRNDLSGISNEGDALLGLLENGRALRGSEVENDGCVFSWLLPAEVTTLHESLVGVDMEHLDEEMAEFHQALIETLGQIKLDGSTLLLQAQ